MRWQDKKETKKGNIGEEIIKNMLREQGYVLYEPIDDLPLYDVIVLDL